MKRFFIVTAFVLMAGLLMADVCPEQSYFPIPTTMDPNQIVTDPVTGDKLLVSVGQGIVGIPYTIQGRTCDPDEGDKVRAYLLPDGPELVLDPNGCFTIPVNLVRGGWTYVSVGATDGIAERCGTYAVYARVNRPPSLCGGLSAAAR